MRWNFWGQSAHTQIINWLSSRFNKICILYICGGFGGYGGGGGHDEQQKEGHI